MSKQLKPVYEIINPRKDIVMEDLATSKPENNMNIIESDKKEEKLQVV